MYMNFPVNFTVMGKVNSLKVSIFHESRKWQAKQAVFWKINLVMMFCCSQKIKKKTKEWV